MTNTMKAAYLPGNSTVEMRTVPVPKPGHGEVLLAVKASTICGSDIRAIYREHLGKGPERYRGVIAGHEPAGLIVEAGPGCRRFKAGDRVLVYHISRMRALPGLPPRIHDLLQQRGISPRLRLAARRRHGGVHDRRGEGPHPSARLTHLPRRRAGSLRIWHSLRGPRKDRHQWQ